MNFDPERVLALAKMFDFLRAVNTPGEQRAADLVAEEFRRAGLRVERRTIRDVRLHRILWPIYAVCLWLGIAMAFLNASIIARLGLTALGMAGLAAAFRINPGLSRASLLIPTEQVMGRRPCDSAPPARVVVHARHATIPRRSEFIGRLMIGVLGAISLLTLLAPASFDLDLWPPKVAITLLFGWWISTLLLLGLPENLGAEQRSRHSRTGPAVLAELARSWPGGHGDRIEVLFVSTGGIWNGPANLGEFVRRDASGRPTLVVNLDAPGLGPRLVFVGSKPGLALANKAAKGLWLPRRVSRRRWESPFIRLFTGPGLAYVSVRGDQRSAPVDPAVLNATAQLVIEMALRWARQSGSAGEARQSS